MEKERQSGRKGKTGGPNRKTGSPNRKTGSPNRKTGSPDRKTVQNKKHRKSARYVPNTAKTGNVKRVEKGNSLKKFFVMEAMLILAALLVLICIWAFKRKASKAEPGVSSAVSAGIDMEENEANETDQTAENTEEMFLPYCTEETRPSKYIEYTEINVDGNTLSNVSDYQPMEKFRFSKGENYTSVDGIVTFRGNNFRDTASYGYAEMKDYKLNGEWSYTTSSLTYGNASWTGSGWTGQPLMIKWPQKTKAAMNMYDWAKADDELVEIIYACMDGYVYFLELDSGKATRDPLYLGYTFKGSGALDPRGYPILYVGAGYDSYEGTAKAFIINLLDCSIMYTFGDNDPFSLRGSLSFFDSSALVDAETDTLIYPGENGILYLMKLNTRYDEDAGTLSISPGRIVKWHYNGIRSSLESYWLGMEDSAAVYGGYLYVADNGGNLMCISLDTLQLVWVQDVLDDSNSTPVLSMEDGHLYLYVSTSFHLGWRSYNTAEIPIWKIDAENGEIVWKKSYECYTEDGVSGGVQSTIALGKHDLSDFIYVTVSRTGSEYDGVLACIDKKTGKVKWEHTAYYAWSSPVCVYNSDGSGKVLYCSCGGKMYLLDGKSGNVHDTFELTDGAIEASPAVYNDYAVVGTRDCKIWGIRLQ